MTEQSAAGVLDVIGRVLTERGPLPEDDLIAELKACGVELGGDPVAALEDALDEAGDGR